MNLLDKTGLTYFWGKIKAKFLTNVAWDSTNKKITKTLNGTTSDVVTGATILSGMTKSQVTTALGYTPPTTDTNTTYSLSADTTNNKIKLTPSSGSAQSITVPYATSASKLGSSNVGSATQPIYLNAGSPAACTYTLGKSVPSDAVFTDTKVTQTPSDDINNTYEVLLSGSADNSEHNEGVRKTSKLVFNTNAGQLSAVVGNNHSYMQSDTVGVYEKVSSSVEKICAMISDDICLYGTNNTWDGTYSSLKDALDSLRDYIGDVESSYSTLLSNLNTFKAKMKAGDGASVTVSANSYADKTINFGKTFSSTPVVITQLTGSGANNAYRANTACYVTSTSTTSFTVRIYNSSAAQLSVSFNWIAMEK